MRRLVLIVATLIASILAVSHGEVFAQGNSRGIRSRQPYTPSRPTVSPYLNLTRRDGGAISNYHTLVRPQLQQQTTNQFQQEQLNQQRGNVTQLQQQIRAVEPGVRSTGTASVYGDHSHFYPQRTRGR